MSQTPASAIPKHPMPFRDGYWVYRCNHRALRELEESDGRGRSFVEIVADPTRQITHKQNILWALSATQRSASPGVSREEWLDVLPVGDEWEELVSHAFRLVREFLPKPAPEPEPEPEPEDEDEEPGGNQVPAPSQSVAGEPTGTTDSTSLPS